MEHQHLTENEIAGYVDNALTDSERGRVETHLDACAACRDEVVAAVRLIHDAARTAPARISVDAPADAAAGAPVAATALEPRRSGRRWIASGGVAVGLAAAAVAVLLLRAPQQANAPVVRGAALSAESAILAPIFPSAGAVVTPASLRFRWHAATADAYRVTLLSESGEPVWTADVTDTTVMLPATVRVAPGSSWFWRVDALTEGRSVSTGVQPFRVAP